MDTPAVRLEVVAGNAAGMSILVDDQLVIGRHAQGAGQLAADEELSRSHAMITRDSSGYVGIEDLGSTNGTFVNGLRINGPQTLSEGDSIELGGTTLVVHGLAPVEPLGALDPAAPEPAQPTVVPSAAPAVAPPAPGLEAGLEAAEPETAAEAAGPAVAPATQAEAAAPEAAAAEIPSKLAVRVEVDFAAREARIVLDAAEPVLLRFDGGEWRAGSSPG
jgi:pSer/pThr/pTyr-binding forkhead associated (FHA) protein